MKISISKALTLFLFVFVSHSAWSQCPINGNTTIQVGASTTLSLPTGTAQCSQCYDWDVTSSGVSISGSDMNNTVTITGVSTGKHQVCVRYLDELGCHDCCTLVKVTQNDTSSGGNDTGGGSCDAQVRHISCSPGNNGFNAMINASLTVTNPFVNTSNVTITAHPTYHPGSFLAAGGNYNINGSATTILPTQFLINAATNAPGGFYVIILVTYTDLTTGDVCKKTIKALLTGGCSSAPY